MGCPKCLWKFQVVIVIEPRPITLMMYNKQEFQNRKFPVKDSDELLQYWNRIHDADAAHAITLPQRKDYSLFIFCGKIIISIKVIDDEGNGRRMCQHACYWCSTCANKGK